MAAAAAAFYNLPPFTKGSFFLAFQMRNGEREIEELRQTNQILSERLELLSRSASSYYSTNASSSSSSSSNMSLLNELELSGAASKTPIHQSLRR